MNPLASCVSLHPYFKVHEGQLDAFRSLMDRFVERTATEERVLFYGFTVNGNEVFCREGYLGAEESSPTWRMSAKSLQKG
jgi:hypothetical protein